MKTIPGHRCLDCAGKAPADERRNEGHVSVRFGDAMKYRILIEASPLGTYDEEDISRVTYEAQAGREHGWARVVCRTEPKWHLCEECGAAACDEIVQAAIRIEAVAEE